MIFKDENTYRNDNFHNDNFHLDGIHEKGIFANGFPIRLAFNNAESFSYPMHWHSALEIVYVIKNDYALIVGSKEYNLKEKDILIIPSGEIHGMDTHNNKGERVFIQIDISMLQGFWDISLYEPLITQMLNQIKKISSSSESSSSDNSSNLHVKLQEQLVKIVDEFSEINPESELTLNARIYDILAILVRNFKPEGFDVESNSSSSKTNRIAGLEKINNAFKYIEENYKNDITLLDVSRHVGFSESYFSKLFKEITEKNFSRYLNEYRVKKAEKLLSEDKYSILEISQRAGFNSIATFNRVFKEIKGCNPTDYKEAQRGL